MGYIYKITNNINDKVYVGQTRGSVQERWRKHKAQAARGDGAKLQRAIRKYGVQNFGIEQIEECENDLLDEREKYWVEYYDSYHTGYNSTRGGDGGLSNKIAMIKDGVIVQVFDNQFDASAAAGCRQQRVCDVCKGRRGSTHGVVFRFLDATGNTIEPNVPKTHKDSYRTPVYATSLLDGSTTYFESATAAANALGLSVSKIIGCLNGRQKTSGNYTFQRAPKTCHVYVTSVSDYTQRYVFTTQREACAALGVHHMAASDAMTGRALSGAGYFWTDYELSQDEYNERLSRMRRKFLTKSNASDTDSAQESVTLS